MGTFSNYDIWNGLVLIGAYFSIFAFLMLMMSSPRLYSALVKQDTSLATGSKLNIPAEVADMLKRVILWVIGYRGEDREKIAVADVNLEWVSKYQVSIFFRLLPVYAFYILSLVVLTRPVFSDGTGYQIFKYSENLYELFALLVMYIVSNIVFDLLSLRWTISHLMKAKATSRYLFFFLKDLVVAALFFLFSQTVSCVLWVLKREAIDQQVLTGGLLSKFAEITLWPYAFVSGQGASEIVSPLFPGQLIITGTVFLPSLILAAIFVIFAIFLFVTRFIKRFLLSKQLDRICRLFLTVHLVGMFQPTNPGNQFRYCNYAFMALLNISFIATISAIIGALVVAA